jgi:hypothetical protein
VGASNVPLDVGTTGRQAPERVVDRADERPGADVGRLEFELRSEPVHDRVDRTDVEPFREQRPNQMGCIERSLAHERLGIDHEPGFALGGEHVPQMEVPVGQDGLLGRVREVAAEIGRRWEEPFVEGPILPNEPPWESSSANREARSRTSQNG